MIAFQKIATLKKAANGEILTEQEKQILHDCAEDYRPRLLLGNGFKVTRMNVIEAFDIIYDDVKWMTGGRRQRAIRLLIATGAAGYRQAEIQVPREHPTDETRADGMAVPVDQDEILEAS